MTDKDRESDPCTITGDIPKSPTVVETIPGHLMPTFSNTHNSLNH